MFDFNISKKKKEDESLLECLKPSNPLFGLNESVQNEKHTKKKEEGEKKT